jgi:hypothetical protein
MAQYGMNVIGDKAVIRALRNLPDSVQRTVLAKVIRRVEKPMLQAARKNVRRRSGQLAKSLGVVIRRYKGTSVWGVLGPRWGFAAEWKGQKINPFYYAHLVEGGHRTVRGDTIARSGYTGTSLKQTIVAHNQGKRTQSERTGKHTGDVPAYPFLRPAFEQHESSAKRQAIKEIAKEIEKLAAKAAAANAR